MSKPEMHPAGNVAPAPRGLSESPPCAACGAAGARWRGELGIVACTYCAAVAATAKRVTCCVEGCDAPILRSAMRCAQHEAPSLEPLPLFGGEP